VVTAIAATAMAMARRSAQRRSARPPHTIVDR
jgi:hypothetical protein